jgi:hypothetical protein
MAEDNFRVTFIPRKGDERPLTRGFSEPAEAIDRAEFFLQSSGIPNESYCEVFFNGEPEPHYRVFLLPPDHGQTTFGLLMTKAAKWDVSYPQGYGVNLEMPPPWYQTQEQAEGPTPTEQEQEKQQEAEDGKHEKDDDADSMDMGGDDDEEDDDFNEDEDGDDEAEDDDESGTEGDGESDSEGEGDEDELPRLTFFSKMRGPKGWRKRAESDSERDSNRFEFRVGVLDPDDSRRDSARERDVRVRVQFSEHDLQRDKAELRILVPENAEWEMKGRWMVTEIPLYEDED